MRTDEQQPARLADDEFIRNKLFSGEKSSLQRYKELTVGPDASLARLLHYELVTMLLGGLPGALGLLLRKIFYPRLFRHCGRGVVFGRDLVIRNARNVRLGDQVIIDDDCVIDGRGAGQEQMVIGNRVIVGRGAMLQSKIGPVHLGRDCDIGSGCIVHSQGATYIGDEVVLGGGCKISGGNFQIERSPEVPGPSEMMAREQTRWSSGPIRIGSRSILGMGCMVLDGVELGEGVVLGAGSIATKSIPAWTVAVGAPAKVIRERDSDERPGARPAAPDG